VAYEVLLTPIDFQIVKKNGTPLAKLAFPALKRCVEYYYFHTVWTSRYTLKQPYAVAFGTSQSYMRQWSMVVVMYCGSKGSYGVRLRLSLLLFQLRIGVRILLLLDFAEVDFVTVWCFCFAMMLLQHTDFGELPR
jgi:hypothetical protein